MTQHSNITVLPNGQINGAVSQETAYIVDNYPWGFRFKTQQRRWIESTKHGQRLCIQTKDPKNGRWCAVKKATYNWVEKLYIDAEGHVQSSALHRMDGADPAKLDAFQQRWTLSDEEAKEFDMMRQAIKRYNEKKLAKASESGNLQTSGQSSPDETKA